MLVSRLSLYTSPPFSPSGLIRDFQPAQDAFVQQDGFSYLVRAMGTDIEKLQTKSAFLLGYLLMSQPEYKGRSQYSKDINILGHTGFPLL